LATRFHFSRRDHRVATGLTALHASNNVLSIVSHVCQQHVADMAELAELAPLADKAQIVCPFAKVDAFIEITNIMRW
jgi:hypothetical protein